MTQLCSFFVGEHLFGVRIEQVREVLRPQQMTPVPTSPRLVRGLLNLRGDIVVAIDLRQRIGLEPMPRPMHVVVMSERGLASLLCDDVGDVRDVPDDVHEAPPGTIRGPLEELVSGVVKLPSEWLLVIDVERAVSVGPVGVPEDACRPS